MYIEDLQKADIDFATDGDHTVIEAPTGGKYIAIDFISFIATVANVIQFQSGSTAYGGALPFGDKGSLTWENNIQNEHGIITCEPNEAFVINTTEAQQLGGLVRYRIVGN